MTKKTSPSESISKLNNAQNGDVEASERPVPGKWWSAEEIGTAGAKANTGRSRFSVVAPVPTPDEPRSPKTVKPPRPPSIFTTKTSIYKTERESNGEPEVVRPGSRQVKTWSRHISAQFMDFGRPMRSPTREEDGAEEAAETTKSRPGKRDSKAVVTDLDWMEYEMPKQ